MNSCNYRFKDTSKIQRTIRMARRNDSGIAYADKHTMRYRTSDERHKFYKRNSYGMMSFYLYRDVYGRGGYFG